MKESAALHRLVHSLSQNEKRYFNLFASAHRDSSDYLKIFKAIDEQKIYNESLLKEQLIGGISHFAVKKNQLYNLLLRSLRAYHEGRTFDSTLKEMMLNASILSDKALYDDCNAVLLRARKIAQRYEEWKILLEILHRRFTIIHQLSGRRHFESEVVAITKEEDEILKQINNYGLIGKLNIQLSLLLRKSGEESNKSIEKLIKHEVLRSEKNAHSFRAGSLYYVIWSSYLIYKNEFAKAAQHLRKHIQLYNQFPQFIEASPGNYLSAMKELLEVNFRLRKFHEVDKLIEQLKQLPDHSPVKKIGSRRFRQLIFSWTFRIELAMIMHNDSINKMSSYVGEQEEYFSRIEKLMETKYRMETALALASFHFLSGNEKQAVHFLQKIFSDSSANHFSDLHFAALFLHWLIHFDSGNFDLLKYLSSPLERIRQKQKNLFRTQKLMIDFMEKAMSEKSSSKSRTLRIDFLKKFSLLKKNNAEAHLYDYFDITLWLKKGK